ncbi:CDP-paratose 2-epimerase [Stella humosa]|uniref:CDP-paratose 2-epimerase n=1 Tax=Stella humosa TaxID=94 RepID=A0A3N1M2J3_9PROT|nr:NAD-dependent epimerase/dehydratase family protein [Stella humosa]ROP99941.1 CDP-paratose 2-epimerase [Stella humosa]BBK30829.1 3-beta hydroxysteroid dehydrogenase [Stella humosa]
MASHHKTILVTGGAGFVGSHLAILLKRDRPGARVLAFDNLKRRGSELALARLAAGGVEFVHGDVRQASDLADAGAFDLLVDCSAEPSVHAGYAGGGEYLVDTNLGGTTRCLEAARRHGADMLFLSTSRVYPIAGLRALPLERRGNRLDLAADAAGVGWSATGIARAFPLDGARSLYGATKLASELLVHEYGAMYGLRTVVNRCGVLTGPWQMGKVDQGFFVLWAARHLYGGPLSYMGFGGEGLQVRDILHVADLYALLDRQLGQLDRHAGCTYNVGGGRDLSLSLRELSALCGTRGGDARTIGGVADTAPADVPWYVTDAGEVRAATGWVPERPLDAILEEVFRWLTDHRSLLEPILGMSGGHRTSGQGQESEA